jgi:threonine aldolase
MKAEVQTRRQFYSDNYAGICPEAFASLAEANQGHSANYGNDEWTEKAADMLRDLFETKCEVFFVFNGTAANSLALASMCQPHNSILCHEHAHIETAECGAPEFFSNGSKVLLLPGANGKIDPKAIEGVAKKRTDVHFPKARAISITQATEAGTVYSRDELQAVIEMAKKLNLRVHMDGARFANTIAAIKAKPKEITWQMGVDVLCFGGTKNGMAVGEAVVIFNPELAREFDYRRKQGAQLASKMRFLSASWVGMLKDGAWLRRAGHANAMAKRLETALQGVPRIKIAYPADTNGVFVLMPLDLSKALRERGWRFSTHVTPDNIRLMCSWDTTPEDVDAIAADIKDLAAKG